MNYYHSSPVPLGVGSVILPGNWGRLVRLYDANNFVNGINEVGIELARRSCAPTKPSRLDAVFVVESYERALAYRDTHHRAGIIYRVEPTDPLIETNHHVGNSDIPISQHGPGFVETAIERFRAYWLDDHTDNREVLVSVPIRILERLD